MKHLGLMLILTACICTMPRLATAADSPATAFVGDSATQHARGDVDVRELIREVAAREHKRVIWDPRLFQNIDIGNLERQQVTYPQLLTLLRIHGFAVVPVAGMLTVVPDANIRFEGLPLISPDNIKALDDEWVTTVLPVKSISAVQLVTILRPLVPPTGQINAYMERNALIIVDRAANVRRIVDLARTFEKLPANPPNASEHTSGP